MHIYKEMNRVEFNGIHAGLAHTSSSYIHFSEQNLDRGVAAGYKPDCRPVQDVQFYHLSSAHEYNPL